jgi:hypothetical protein
VDFEVSLQIGGFIVQPADWRRVAIKSAVLG